MTYLSTDPVQKPVDNIRTSSRKQASTPSDNNMDDWRPLNRRDWISIALAVAPALLIWALVIILVYLKVRA